MLTRHLAWIRCPLCQSPDLEWRAWKNAAEGDVEEGAGLCRACGEWFPIEGGVLDLLTGPLAYAAERAAFLERNRAELAALGCAMDVPPQPSLAADAATEQERLCRAQQQHSDWFAENTELTYTDFAATPFWRAVDAIHFGEWRKAVRPGEALLEAGCAQGRATFAFADLDLDIVGFDVSRKLVRQARARHLAGRAGQPWKARMSFLLADACAMPVRDGSFDDMLVYGVLHHVPDPAAACAEILRVLRAGGRFFGSENNVSAFRRVFDFLMRIAPLWKEEAGPEALIDEARLRGWFAADVAAAASARIGTRVFLPPHLVNLFPDALAEPMVRLTDALGNALPFFRKNGGLIHIALRKSGADPRR